MLDKMLILFALRKKMQREGVFSDFFYFLIFYIYYSQGKKQA